MSVKPFCYREKYFIWTVPGVFTHPVPQMQENCSASIKKEDNYATAASAHDVLKRWTTCESWKLLG